MLFGTVAAVLAAVGGALYVLRLREQAASERVTDEMIEQIEETGRVELEEPLDFGEIADEESRFWEEEPWDEADEY
ncbi:MAG TPA: hypothetical protein VMM79_11220 [Longimicrobiales bacterium]|nr:hypothetical protein [Longimicrobiales bacterium]